MCASGECTNEPTDPPTNRPSVRMFFEETILGRRLLGTMIHRNEINNGEDQVDCKKTLVNNRFELSCGTMDRRGATRLEMVGVLLQTHARIRGQVKGK